MQNLHINLPFKAKEIDELLKLSHYIILTCDLNETTYNLINKNNIYLFYGFLSENNNEYFTNDKLNAIHKVVYDKPYDLVPKDWIDEIFHKDTHPQKTDRFWCSALVGYIYTKAGLIDEKTDWSVLRASDFSLEYKDILTFNEGCSLEDKETQIL